MNSGDYLIFHFETVFLYSRHSLINAESQQMVVNCHWTVHMYTADIGQQLSSVVAKPSL